VEPLFEHDSHEGNFGLYAQAIPQERREFSPPPAAWNV
jgi:hypothetical protein